MEPKQELKHLKNEISKIHKRNKKVELDKKWETSTSNRICPINTILKIYKKNLGNKTDKIKTLDKYKIYCYNTKRVLNYSLLHKKP